MNAIEFKDYQKAVKRNTVLDIPSLSLSQKQIHGFWGHNGSGKTMLFRAVSGLIHPDSGYVSVFGKKIGEDCSFPDNLGLLIEHIGFWPQVSGMDNLRFLASIKSKINDNDILNALDRIGLSRESAEKKYSTYSLGMKQKLAIAQAIMERPDLLILDEPSNSLDEKSVEALWKIIHEEKANGATVLISSHHKEELTLCDCIYKVDSGTVKKIEENF